MDGYRIQRADPREAGEMYALMRRVWERMENKELFAVGSMDVDWFRRYLGPDGFGVTARDADGVLAGILVVCIPGTDEENIGWDIGMTEDQLMTVCNMDTAAVLPEHRGHGLEARMFRFAEQELAGSAIRYLMATISPHNPPSLHSAEKLGYQILLTKEKYGGFLRHILLKPINGAKLEDLTFCREREKG